jgi:hypothetical protein
MWIESHQSLATHRKTKVLKRLLKIRTPQAIGHLHLLWWWCLDNAPDGDLNRIDDADLADAADWLGDAKLFVSALINAGFIDVIHTAVIPADTVSIGADKTVIPADTRVMHDWYQYAGKLIDRKKANADRQQAHRNAVHNNDMRVTSPLRTPATVPTVPTVPTKVTIPYSVTLPIFVDKKLWEDWLEVRKKKKAPATQRALELSVKELEHFKETGQDPNKILEQSIMRGYVGLFELKENGNGRTGQNTNARQLPTTYTRPEDLT